MQEALVHRGGGLNAEANFEGLDHVISGPSFFHDFLKLGDRTGHHFDAF